MCEDLQLQRLLFGLSSDSNVLALTLRSGASECTVIL